jgi:hypothetical protein
MSNARGNAIKWKLTTGLLVFGLFNVWMLYKRIKFYMEHSFDLINPDIEYLIERY